MVRLIISLITAIAPAQIPARDASWQRVDHGSFYASMLPLRSMHVENLGATQGTGLEQGAIPKVGSMTDQKQPRATQGLWRSTDLRQSSATACEATWVPPRAGEDVRP